MLFKDFERQTNYPGIDFNIDELAELASQVIDAPILSEAGIDYLTNKRFFQRVLLEEYNIEV